MRLKNILIVVKDIEKSKKFYQELFGLNVVLDHDGNMILTEGLVLQDEQIWKKFNSACDAFFAAKAKAQEGEKSINVIRKERDKLIRAYEANRATIATRENNIGFLTIGKSKEENPLVAEMLKNIEKLKADQVELVKKIKALEEKIRNAEEN